MGAVKWLDGERSERSKNAKFQGCAQLGRPAHVAPTAIWRSLRLPPRTILFATSQRGTDSAFEEPLTPVKRAEDVAITDPVKRAATLRYQHTAIINNESLDAGSYLNDRTAVPAL
jgi:hypothetical protein